MFRSIMLAGWTAAALFAATGAPAQDADHYRGGWRTDSGDPHVYQFIIKGGDVTGVYCTHCADATTLAPLEGTFDPEEGIAFTIRHLDMDGALVREDRARARLEDGALAVTGTRGADGEAFEHAAIKDPRGPVPAFYPVATLPPDFPDPPVLEFSGGGGGGGGGGAPAAYEQPAPWRQLTADDVTGMWIGFGTGMDKQIFMIRRDGDGLFGLVCGRCDNPYTFGAMDDFKIHGDTLEFDIVHQDWGQAPIPFERHVTAHIAMNEMRISAVRDDQPDGPAIVASLIGPIAIESTRGNVVEDVAD